MSNPPISELIASLPNKAQRGSKPRCHCLLHGADHDVSARLTGLIKGWGEVPADAQWLPRGFKDPTEAQLGKHLLPEDQQKELTAWWLAVPHPQANTPNWDIASTCLIDGKQGFLLVEAKAHVSELEGKGKRLKPNASNDSKTNHEHIRECIARSSSALEKATRKTFNLTADHNYQMSNRFAWAWKLADMGYPVILVYLGFLNATEMQALGQTPFSSKEEWEQLVREHGHSIVGDGVWETKHSINGIPLIPIIRAIHTAIEP